MRLDLRLGNIGEYGNSWEALNYSLCALAQVQKLAHLRKGLHILQWGIFNDTLHVLVL